eukprot:s1129_g12.t4
MSLLSVSLLALVALAAADRLVVRLQRVPGNGTHFYVGRVSVGQPKQSFSVLFDTASGHVLLPHGSCKSPACHKHQRFLPWKSSTAVDVNSNGLPVQKDHHLTVGKVRRDAVNLEFSQADLGEGVAEAVLVKDKVCLGNDLNQLCADVDVMAAVSLEKSMFEEMPYDGIVGLGLGGLSAEAGSDFVGRLTAMHPQLLPQIGLSLGAQSGELYLGHHEVSRMAQDLTWFPVLHPEDGFWEVSVQGVRLGNKTLDNCESGCRGIIDTGASRLGVQRENFEVLRSALSTASPLVGGGCRGEDLIFDLGPMALTLRVEDYAAGNSCAPQLGALELDPKDFHGVYAFGEATLRQHPGILLASFCRCSWERSHGHPSFTSNGPEKDVSIALCSSRNAVANSSSSWSAAGGDVSSLTFRTSWEGWPPPMDLAAAKSLAATVTKPGSSRVSGLALQAAARALYEIKDFVGSALLLRELRDFGVDLEVLERRLEVVKAQNLFDQVAVRLGVAYLDAGLWRDAWEALMGACAQPRLSRPLATIAVAALADAAERGANASEALQQVELLQGLLDAEAVLRALPRDRREGLEIYMALSLEKIGRKKESRQLLTRLAQQGTSTRRKQAEWALLVQDAEVSDNAEGREMRRIWEEAPSPILPSASASRGAGAAKMMSKEARSGRSALDEAAPVATLLLALPLAVAKQLPLLEQLMKLEAEQEDRRRELAALLENQGTRQNTPEEAERQHLMKENRERLEELRFDQMILVEKQRELQHAETDVPATLEAKPEELTPFGEYYRKHILKVLPPRLYVDFLDHTAAREAAAAALQVCHPLKLRDEDGDSSVAVSAASRARRGDRSAGGAASGASRGSRRATPSGASSGATERESVRSSDSTAATGPGVSNRGPRISVPKLVLPKRLQDGSDPSGRPLDSRQRKTREALEKLTAVYSVPISRSCPSLFSGKRAGAAGAPCEKAEKDGQEKRPPRPPLPVPPKERLVNKPTTEATRVRSEQALDKERHVQRRPEAKLQPLSSNPKKEKAYGPSLRDELRVRGELGSPLRMEKTVILVEVMVKRLFRRQHVDAL